MIGVITISMCSTFGIGTDAAIATGIMQILPRSTCVINPMIVHILIMHSLVYTKTPHKKTGRLSVNRFLLCDERKKLSLGALGAEALATENRSIPFGFKRHLALRTALRTHRIVQLSRPALAGLTTALATQGRRVIPSGVEFLLTVGKGKSASAIAACKLLICHRKRRRKENKRNRRSPSQSSNNNVEILSKDAARSSLHGIRPLVNEIANN